MLSLDLMKLFMLLFNRDIVVKPYLPFWNIKQQLVRRLKLIDTH